MFEATHLAEVEITTETLRFAFASFGEYFGSVERGEGHMGQEYMALPETVRRVVREEMRHELDDVGGPIEVGVGVRIACGQH